MKTCIILLLLVLGMPVSSVHGAESPLYDLLNIRRCANIHLGLSAQDSEVKTKTKAL